MLAAPLCPVAALSGAGADKIALHVREAAENGVHQSARTGAGVGPRFRASAELRLGVHDLFDNSEQVKGTAGEAVNACHRHHVAGADGFKKVQKLAPVAVRAGDFLAVNVAVAASGVAKLLKLAVERLPTVLMRA